MTENQSVFEDIISKILLIEKDQINDNISRESFEEWDSMTHLVLISELEQAYNFIFKDDDVTEIQTINDSLGILDKFVEIDITPFHKKKIQIMRKEEEVNRLLVDVCLEEAVVDTSKTILDIDATPILKLINKDASSMCECF